MIDYCNQSQSMHDAQTVRELHGFEVTVNNEFAVAFILVVLWKADIFPNGQRAAKTKSKMRMRSNNMLAPLPAIPNMSICPAYCGGVAATLGTFFHSASTAGGRLSICFRKTAIIQISSSFNVALKTRTTVKPITSSTIPQQTGYRSSLTTI